MITDCKVLLKVYIFLMNGILAWLHSYSCDPSQH